MLKGVDDTNTAFLNPIYDDGVNISPPSNEGVKIAIMRGAVAPQLFKTGCNECDE